MWSWVINYATNITMWDWAFWNITHTAKHTLSGCMLELHDEGSHALSFGCYYSQSCLTSDIFAKYKVKFLIKSNLIEWHYGFSWLVWSFLLSCNFLWLQLSCRLIRSPRFGFVFLYIYTWRVYSWESLQNTTKLAYNIPLMCLRRDYFIHCNC